MAANAASAALTGLELIQAVEAFAQARVLILGDIMLDEYLTGDAERISPEAPVPVVKVAAATHLAGGAGNVARNITALGARAVLVGVCGRDAAGADLQACLDKDGIDHFLLPLGKRPTTVKTRVLARQQQVVRIDRENAARLTPAQSCRLLDLVATKLPGCGAIVLSDYGKGLVNRTTMAGLNELARARNLPLLVDPKPENFNLYKGVTLLTPNAKETGASVNLPVTSPREILKAGRTILRRLNCRHLVTTLGSRGMAVFENKDAVSHIPTSARQVFDVTGAGDTVIAALALGAATGLPLIAACLLANYAAGIVVGKVGAATVSPNQLAEAVATLPRPELQAW